MTALTGLAMAPAGIGVAAPVVGAKIASSALRKYGEAAYPVTTSNLYKGLSNQSKSLGSLADSVAGQSKLLAATIGSSDQSEASMQNLPQDQPVLSATQRNLKGSLRKEINGEQSFPSLNNTASSNPNLESAFKKVLGEDMYKNQPVKEVIQAVKADPVDHAIMLMESGGNPKAKNPESSASGLFQLIKKTAGNLGVEDVFDAGDNYDGYLKLKQTAIDKYGVDPSDYKSLYSFHYLGETAFRKLLNGEELSGKQKAQVKYLKSTLFPKLDKFYQKAIKETGQVVA